MVHWFSSPRMEDWNVGSSVCTLGKQFFHRFIWHSNSYVAENSLYWRIGNFFNKRQNLRIFLSQTKTLTCEAPDLEMFGVILGLTWIVIRIKIIQGVSIQWRFWSHLWTWYSTNKLAQKWWYRMRMQFGQKTNHDDKE